MPGEERKELAIGIFVVLGLLTIGLLILLSGEGGLLFRETYLVRAYMDHVGGLKPGAPVKIGGYDVGRVEDIRLVPPGERKQLPRPEGAGKAASVVVEMSIQQRWDLPEDTVARIASVGLVGDTFLELVPGESDDIVIKDGSNKARIEGQPYMPNDLIFEKVVEISGDVKELVTHINDVIGEEEFKRHVQRIVANADEITREAKELLGGLDASAANLEKATGEVAAGVKDVRGVIGEVNGGIKDIRRVIAKVEGSIDATVADEKNQEAFRKMLSDAEAAGGEINRAAENVASISKKLDKLVDEEGQNIRGIIKDLRATTAGAARAADAIRPDKGVMKLFTSEDTYSNIVSTLKQTGYAITELRQGLRKTTRTVDVVGGKVEEWLDTSKLRLFIDWWKAGRIGERELRMDERRDLPPGTTKLTD